MIQERTFNIDDEMINDIIINAGYFNNSIPNNYIISDRVDIDFRYTPTKFYLDTKFGMFDISNDSAYMFIKNFIRHNG